MGLSAEERETTISWSDADEGVAHVYTCQPRMRKLAKHPLAQLVKRHTDEDEKLTGEEWDLPVACLRITFGKKRQMSEAHREAARQRMRAMKRAGVRMVG